MIKKRTEYSIEDREEMVKREREREEEVRLKLKLKLERESPESVRRRKRTCPIGKCIGTTISDQDSFAHWDILYYILYCITMVIVYNKYKYILAVKCLKSTPECTITFSSLYRDSLPPSVFALPPPLLLLLLLFTTSTSTTTTTVLSPLLHSSLFFLLFIPLSSLLLVN